MLSIDIPNKINQQLISKSGAFDWNIDTGEQRQQKEVNKCSSECGSNLLQ